MRCPSCSSENPTDARFCQRCGTSLIGVCPLCSTVNVTDAQFCKQCGNRLAAPPATTPTNRLASLQQSAPTTLQDKFRAAATHLDGERKPVTILFTDIVGSTTLAEKLDPEEWKEIVAGAHTRVSEAVYRYEGTIAQLLGDGVLAFFGAPITHEDDPLRAVHAALDIQSAISDYASSLSGYVDSFQMRIGLHTGLVVVGSVGSDLHMEYLAVGDSVNLAARLQAACAPGQVLISDATAKRVRGEFDLEDLGEITVKGKAEPVHVFRPLQRKSTPASGRGIEGLDSPLVGRTEELATFRARLDALLEGHGQIVGVAGEAGIGKSRLVDSGKQEYGSLRWLEGRSLSYGAGLSYWAINQLLQADLGLSDGDPEPRVRAALRRRLKSLDPEHAEDLYPYLAHLLGVKLEGVAADRVRALDGETLKQQVLASLVSYWSRVAESGPTVLVLEDLHWADPSTLDALERLLPLADRVPLMLLFLYRIETDKSYWRLREEAARDYRHRFTEIELCPLSAAESETLVGNLLAIAELPDVTRRMILDRSEGNPFYLEEIVRTLIDQGAIVREGDRWKSTAQLEGVTIPETLQGLLLARIDRLEEEARRTLQLAAVIGQSFLYRLLAAIAQAERELDEQLTQLQRVDLVREKTRRPELEYMFKHALTQQAAYDSLLLEHRRDFHRRVGVALEQLFADRQEEILGLLAHHFDRAGETGRAVEYLLKAGDKMRLEDAQEEAIGYYQRAIELLEMLGDDARAARTWLKLGLVYHTNFDFAAAHHANEMAFALLKKKISTRAQYATPVDRPLNLARSRLFAFHTPDPALASWAPDITVVADLFAGLAEMDEELNLVPKVARSWEILDAGKRYLFHLRDDVRWTDGTPVTAADFEWAWKRNLRLDSSSPYRTLMDDIVGAREFREGKNPDPESVAVRALDPLTLEVRLVEPVAYFPLLMMMPFAYPLPRAAIERYGDEWWKPEHIISNGAFRLTALDPGHHLSLRRNPDYFGEFPGNLDGIDYVISTNAPLHLQEFREGQLDVYRSPARLVTPDLADFRRADYYYLSAACFILSPDHPPLDDVRIRRALMLALDRASLMEAAGLNPGQEARGGLVPPGIPGHTPEMGVGYDVESARRLLADAGYPAGKGMPPLTGFIAAYLPSVGQAAARQWKQNLGIEVTFRAGGITADVEILRYSHIASIAWIADWPDPANFLQQSSMYDRLRESGWYDERYEQLIAQAAHTTVRAQRMAMYREADRILVAEQALIIPVAYGTKWHVLLVQPEVDFRLKSREMVKRRKDEG